MLLNSPSPFANSSPRQWRRLLLLVTIVLIESLCVASTSSAPSAPSEYDVKAAYLFNFGKFVRWPAGKQLRTFSICVVGQDHFGGALDRVVSGETISGAPVNVRRVSSAEDVGACQIAFIDRSEERRMAVLLPQLERAGVLTVSDMPGFSDRGGMIEFLLSGNRVRFEVNLSAAEKAGLSFSSDLLKVATKVRRAGA